MKTSWLAFVLLFSSLAATRAQAAATNALPDPTNFTIVTNDYNSRVWERINYFTNMDGTVIPQKHRFTELASGMYYRTNGQWMESKEEITSCPGGAVALQGQHWVGFANNLNSGGAIEMQTPDGKRLRSNILGLMYVDQSTGRALFIALLQDSQGQLIANNQVLYTNAFEGINSDVRYTYKKSGLEQDVILREIPPAPELFGLNSDTTILEVVTEFINPPAATVTETGGPTVYQADDTIKWGSTTIGRGKAFDLSDDTGNQTVVPVNKQYVKLQGRYFLIERVQMKNIQAQLNNLPEQASIQIRQPMVASLNPEMPATPPERKSDKPMLFAYAPVNDKGYVLDYVTLNNSYTNFVFQGDTTYYINGTLNLSGTNTFEGGTVLKYNTYCDGGSILNILEKINCATGPYRPAIFTSVDDNSVGEEISDYSGTLNVSTALSLAAGGYVHDIRVSYLGVAIDSAANYNVANAQFLNCGQGLKTENASFYAGNILMSGVGTGFYGQAYQGVVEQMTYDQGTLLADDSTGSSGNSRLALTNSLLTEVSGVGAVTIVSNSVVALSDNTSVYQVVGNGNYYLATNSPYHNFGSGGISGWMLGQLAQKTTYPPVVFVCENITDPMTLSPQATRDNSGTPDLGYHYDPLDYAFGGCSLVQSEYWSGSITVTAGTAIGTFFTSWNYYGYPPNSLALFDGASIAFNGTESNPCILSTANAVQEGGNGNWFENVQGGWDFRWIMTTFGFYGSGSSPLPQVTGNFVKWYSLFAKGVIFNEGGYVGIVQLSNSELYNIFELDPSPSLYFTNCLLSRSGIEFMNDNSFAFENCTFIGGGLTLSSYANAFWQVENSAFDGTAFRWFVGPYSGSEDYSVGTDFVQFDHNAFNTNNLSWQNYCFQEPCWWSAWVEWPVGTLELAVPAASATDVSVPDYNWQSSWLGSYYLPSDSPLIDAGSANANLLGLFEFTTQTNQAVEGFSTVDIGYHYVATDATGNPKDTYVSGIPDYLVDAAGNGMDTNGLAYSWEAAYYGQIGLDPAALDTSSNTLLYDYTNNFAPANNIWFSIETTNNYLGASVVPVQVAVAGSPYFIAMSVDDTNFMADAVWNTYGGSNVTVNLGGTQGWHDVWIGLRRHADDASAAIWQWKRLKLDHAPPTLVITSPTNSTVKVPMIQLTGYSPEPLDSISYDITNALGLVANQDAGVTRQFYDPIVGDFTTNWFECLDVPLTNGANTIIIHATDLAGNVSTNNFSFTLDYTGATNPVIALTWPVNGMELCGSSFTLRGSVNDPTATIVATITATNGNTSVVSGVVERSGVLWVENLPLNNGTNWITLNVTNAAGHPNATNIYVVKSDMTLVLTNVDGDLWQPTVNVSGLISPYSGYCVWVNGIKGTNNGDGTWNAANVPMSSSGVASFDMSAVNGTDPNSNTNLDRPARLYMESYVEADKGSSRAAVPPAFDQTWTFTTYWEMTNACTWSNGIGGTGAHRFNMRYDNYDGAGGWLNILDSELMTSPASDWPTVAAGVINGTYLMEYEPYYSLPSSGSSEWKPPVVWEHCHVLMPVDWIEGIPSRWENGTGAGEYAGWYNGHGAYKRTADAVVKLQTGGKALSKRVNLFYISGTAAEVLDKGAYAVEDVYGNYIGDGWSGNPSPTKPIPAQTIGVDGMALGSSGYRWRTYADNDTRDVTPRVKNKDFYTFNVTQQKYTVRDKAYWQHMVQMEIDNDNPRVVIEDYLAANGFMANRQNFQAVYDFYQKVFEERPTEYYWMGLGRLAGAPLYAALSDAQYASPAFSPFQQQLIQMSIDVYSDVAWQFEAYRKGGLQALEDVNAMASGALPITAWRTLDDGIQNDDNDEIQLGNTLIAQWEQLVVLADGYSQLSNMTGITTLMSDLAQNPIWGGPSFSSLESGQNIANYYYRWDWISHPFSSTSNTGIIPLWLQHESAANRLADVQMPLLYRAQQFSYVYQLDNSKTLY